MATSAATQKFSLFALTAMVVGSMVGAGIFSLPRTFGNATGPFGAIIAWIVAAGGMYMLARVFQTLAERKPDLDAGVYAYAKAGFGDYPGFLSVVGYWVGSYIGNVSYWVLIKSTLGAFFPIFGDGNTVTAILVASHRHLALPLHDPEGSPAGRFHQHHRNGCQDRTNPGLHRDLDRRIQSRSLPSELLGRRRNARHRPVRAGPRHHAGHGLCLPRDRRCQRVLSVTRGSARTWALRQSWASSESRACWCW